MCDDSVDVKFSAIDQPEIAVHLRSKLKHLVKMIECEGDVESRFIRCALVKRTSFNDLPPINEVLTTPERDRLLS